jgi:hypothetical protein
MLFDLRGRGRRRTVRVVYVGFALLMGVGFIGFGVGGGFGGGGIFTAATENQGSNSASFANQIKKYRKLIQKQPANLPAWEGLTKNLLHEAAGVSPNGLTPQGRELYVQAAQAWNSYLALNPPKPNPELAQLMVSVYSQEGLNQPAQEVQVLEIVTAARPTSASYYSLLALYAYKAKNPRIGDLAAARAVSLAPTTQRIRLRNELAQAKANPSGEKTYTTTTNGKTYAGKLQPNGTLQATEVKTTPQPAGSSTSTTKKK